jgi:hypothetical protein
MWVPPGFVSAFDAIEQLGRKKYGKEWTGHEKKAAGAPMPSQPKPEKLNRTSQSLDSNTNLDPSFVELMKTTFEKRVKEYPRELAQWHEERQDAARWSAATVVLLSHLWTGQAVLWRLSIEGRLSRVDPKDLLLKNDLQHRLRTADDYNPNCLSLPWQRKASPKYFDTLLVSGLELSTERAADAPTDAGRSGKKNSGKQTAEKQQPARAKPGPRAKIDWNALVPDMQEIWRKNPDWTFQEAVDEMRFHHKSLRMVDDGIIEKWLRITKRSLSE